MISHCLYHLEPFLWSTLLYSYQNITYQTQMKFITTFESKQNNMEQWSFPAPTSQHRTCFLSSHTWLSRQGNKIFRFTIHHLLTKNRDQKSDEPNQAKTRTTRISSFSSIFSHFPNIFFFFFISPSASTAKKRRKPSAHSARRARWARCYLISFLMSNSWVLKDSLFFPFFSPRSTFFPQEPSYLFYLTFFQLLSLWRSSTRSSYRLLLLFCQSKAV